MAITLRTHIDNSAGKQGHESHPVIEELEGISGVTVNASGKHFGMTVRIEGLTTKTANQARAILAQHGLSAEEEQWLPA